MKIIKTHRELLRLDGKSVTCEIEGVEILDAKIKVEDGRVYVCQNEKNGNQASYRLGYDCSWIISNRSFYSYYESDDRSCENIRLTQPKNIEKFKKKHLHKINNLAIGGSFDTKNWRVECLESNIKNPCCDCGFNSENSENVCDDIGCCLPSEASCTFKITRLDLIKGDK